MSIFKEAIEEIKTKSNKEALSVLEDNAELFEQIGVENTLDVLKRISPGNEESLFQNRQGRSGIYLQDFGERSG